MSKEDEEFFGKIDFRSAMYWATGAWPRPYERSGIDYSEEYWKKVEASSKKEIRTTNPRIAEEDYSNLQALFNVMEEILLKTVTGIEYLLSVNPLIYLGFAVIGLIGLSFED